MEAGDILAPVRIVLKIAPQSLRQRRELAAGWLRPPPSRINDTGFAPPSRPSSSLDYGHLLNYFFPETNLFFNLGGRWPSGSPACPPAIARNRPLRLGLRGTSSSDRCLKRVRRPGERGREETFGDPRNLHFYSCQRHRRVIHGSVRLHAAVLRFKWN